MSFTVAIKLVVDEERVKDENAALVALGTHRAHDPERKDDVHVPRVRARNRRTKDVPQVAREQGHRPEAC